MCKGWFIIVLMVIFANGAFGLGGSGTAGDPWRIRSLGDFNDFAADPNYWDGYTRLETDVNLAGLTYATAVIAPDTDTPDSGFQGTMFTGVFDGNDCKVMGLTIDDGGAGNDYLGLFGFMDGGEIRNLGIEDCSISGDRYIGGLVGISSGIVSDCYSTGDIRGSWSVGGLVGGNGYGSRGGGVTPGGPITNCYSTGDVNGIDHVGGLVGNNYDGSVSRCYSTGDVKGIDFVGGLIGTNSGYVVDCNSIVAVIGDDTAGGLVGWNSEGSISDCNCAGNVSGGGSAGGLVGRNSGSISNCHSAGNVNGTHRHVGGLVGYNDGYSSVSNSYSTGNVRGTDDYVGGLVGYNDRYANVSNSYSIGFADGVVEVGGLVGHNEGSVLACNSIGNVRGNRYVAGLVGVNKWGTISNSYCIGEVGGGNRVGGLVGWNYGSVSVCYSGCVVSGSGWSVGGLVGSNIWPAHVDTLGMVSNCLWDVEVQTYGVAKAIGDERGIIVDVVGAGTGQMQTQETFISAGWDFLGEWANGTSEIWRMPDGGGYPALSISYSGIPVALAGSGTGDDPYLIGDASELGMVRWYPEESYFKATSDIDLSGITWPNAVVPRLKGTFDGDGHKLVDLRISGNGYRLGLFGYLGRGGRVRSLGLEGGHVSGAEAILVGALVGHNDEGDVSSCYSTSDVTGWAYVGGLIGRNSGGSVSNCYSGGDVNGIDAYVGGLVGHSNGNGSVSNCYSTANVDGSAWYMGGLVGYNRYDISDCFWDIDMQTHGVSESIGHNFNVGTVTNVHGLLTGQMQTKSTFSSAGWDFDEVWDLGCEGMNYPRLVWEIAVGDLGCPHGVDSRDYSFFADRWMDGDCGDDDDCDGVDFDFSGTVDGMDLGIFFDRWLDGASN